MSLLTRLFDLLLPPRRDALLVRETSPDEVLQLVSPKSFAHDVHEGVALMPYRAPVVGALIREAKFRKNAKAFELLALATTSYLSEALAEERLYNKRQVMLVPVPLSKKRFRERGYNQVQEVAVRMQKQLEDVSLMPHALKRVRDTRAQTSLGKEARLNNVRGAFSSPTLDPSYLYIVIDDVMTTGATLSEAVEALSGGGAKHILPITFSY